MLSDGIDKSLRIFPCKVAALIGKGGKHSSCTLGSCEISMTASFADPHINDSGMTVKVIGAGIAESRGGCISVNRIASQVGSLFSVDCNINTAHIIDDVLDLTETKKDIFLNFDAEML